MEESCNKELIHGSKKKKKKKRNNDNLVFDNLANNSNQQSDNEEKMKSKRRKRKTHEIENHEKKKDEPHEINITKEIDMDVKKIRLDFGDNVKKIKNKKKHITYENEKKIENYVSNFKQPEVLKNKKKKNKNIIEKVIVEYCDEKEKDYDNNKFKKHKKNKLHKKYMENSNSDNFDKSYTYENQKKMKINVQNFKEPEVLKKKKKKKKNIIEKINVDDYDEKCQDNDDIKYKKKVCKKNMENSKREFQIEDKNLEDCVQDEPTVPAETNTESIHSLYSHEYSKDPNRFNARNDISDSLKKKTNKLQMYDDFLYKLPDNIEVLKIPEDESFWYNYNFCNYPEEEVKKYLLKRVEYIADYFDRLLFDNLTEEECQEKELSNFNGPYLPTPQHFTFFSDLNIEIDWEIPEEQNLLFKYHSYSQLKNSDIPYRTKSFLRTEDKILLENWQKFQENYKFYDLRPLIGFRSMKVNHQGGCFIFEEVNYVDPNEKYKFLLYLARGLGNRTRYQVQRRIAQIAMRIQDNEISYQRSYFEPREVAEVEAFIKLFGTDYRAMEFILGKVNYQRYAFCSEIHIKYKNMPIRAGPWQSTEKTRLVRSIFKETNSSSIQELLTSKVPWKKVFPSMQTRHIYHCSSYFKEQLKRRLELASNLTNHETGSVNIYWTKNDMVKLIKLVSENLLGPTISDINWEEVGSHFEVFGPHCCQYRFRLIYGKVPRTKYSNLKEAVDYLLTYSVPQLEQGLITFRREKYTLDELRSLPINKCQSATSSDKWSLKNTIKLIKEVYENAGSSVETTNWNEISSHFKKYDEKICRNHFRYLYFNRIPHRHRSSFDSALEYLKNCICPMLEQKKQRNKRESLLTEEVVNLSPEDRLVFQALLKDISQVDDDEDIAMLQEENSEQLKGQHSHSSSIGCHAVSEAHRIDRLNALVDYIEEKQDEGEIDGDLEDIAEHNIDSYLDELDKEENGNMNLHLSTDGDSSENSEADEIRSENSDGEDMKAMEKNNDKYNNGNFHLSFHKKEASKKTKQLRQIRVLSEEVD